MKPFKNYFFEQTESKTAVIAYGRYNPPTIGHQVLIDMLEDISSKHNVDGFIIPSHTQDNIKNPLSYNEKVEILHQMIDNITILSEGKTFISLLQYLQQAGYTDIIHVAGSDKILDFRELVERFNGKPDRKGVIPFSFNNYNFVSAGQRDPDSDGVEGMSATKLRLLAKKGNLKDFKQGMSNKVSDDLKQKTYNKIRDNIK